MWQAPAWCVTLDPLTIKLAFLHSPFFHCQTLHSRWHGWTKLPSKTSELLAWGIPAYRPPSSSAHQSSMNPQRLIVPAFHMTLLMKTHQFHQIHLHRSFQQPSSNISSTAPGSSSDHRPLPTENNCSSSSQASPVSAGTSPGWTPQKSSHDSTIGSLESENFVFWNFWDSLIFVELCGEAGCFFFLAVNHQALQGPDILIFLLGPFRRSIF